MEHQLFIEEMIFDSEKAMQNMREYNKANMYRVSKELLDDVRTFLIYDGPGGVAAGILFAAESIYTAYVYLQKQHSSTQRRHIAGAAFALLLL